MAKIINPEKDKVLLVDLITSETKKVLIVFFHGVGDVVMFNGIFDKIRETWPSVEFEVAFLKGLDLETLMPEAVMLDGNWEEQIAELPHDFAFLSHFPLEDANDPDTTKGEIACVREYGIRPFSVHKQIVAPRLVAVHFQCTSVPGVANIDPKVAERIWNEILEAGCQPIETHFQHVFHNPVNEKYPFIDNHSRGNTARLRNLIALLGASECFIGGVSGNFHLALSILGPHRVLFLKNRIPGGCFTKDALDEIDTPNYEEGSVFRWLSARVNALT